MKSPTPKNYQLEFTLAGLPKSTNGSHGHWRVKAAHAKAWKKRVFMACWHLRPPEPLETALITLTRVSSVEPDYDNLVISFKPLIDGLRQAQIIADDKRKNVGRPEYKWERGKRGAGCVRVKVEQVTKEQSK